ncbi:MAG: sigma-70 family RNA polymerase sigma factor [Labilithrix sp.]|nr:sigma-70 family RNA polymerase sigma factor [Labilithrix sp.]
MSERAELLPELVRAHFANVWRFLRRLGFEPDVIDDAAQDLFLVVLRRLDEVKPGSERAFLFGAALRIASNLKKKQAREVPTEHLDPESAHDETVASPEERLDGARARALLYRLLSELEESLRAVFVMYELEQMTMQEIADVIEVPLGTVASRLRRARDDFRARLERHRARTGGGRDK